MIDIGISMQEGTAVSDLEYSRWDVSIYGNAVDDRGMASIEFSDSNSNAAIIFRYHAKVFEVELDGQIIQLEDVADVLRDRLIDKSLLLDSTTLSFAELLIIIQAIDDLGIKNFDVFYLEPESYRAQENSQFKRRDFQLSTEISGFEGIPGHTLSISTDEDQHVAFICGFEAERMDLAIEEQPIIASKCRCIFGVPAFYPGWEMDSIANNITVIKERRITEGIFYCPADNPLAIYMELDRVFKSLNEESQLLISPLSCKPMNLGACLFLVKRPKDRVAALYDHPGEVSGRTYRIAKSHLYGISL